MGILLRGDKEDQTEGFAFVRRPFRRVHKRNRLPHSTKARKWTPSQTRRKNQIRLRHIVAGQPLGRLLESVVESGLE